MYAATWGLNISRESRNIHELQTVFQFSLPVCRRSYSFGEQCLLWLCVFAECPYAPLPEGIKGRVGPMNPLFLLPVAVSASHMHYIYVYILVTRFKTWSRDAPFSEEFKGNFMLLGALCSRQHFLTQFLANHHNHLSHRGRDGFYWRWPRASSAAP